MKPNPLSRLTCLNCNKSKSTSLELKNGVLVCSLCKKHYPVAQGIPCFVVSGGDAKKDERIERERAIRDREAKQYNDVIAEYNRRLEKTMMQRALNLSKDDVWLDAGCGIGDVLDKMHKQVNDITACDYSLGSLLCLQDRLKEWKRDNILLVEADLSNLPFCDAAFSCISSGQVLQHLPGRKMFLKSLREILRVLKPEGRAVLTLFQYHPMQKAIFEHVYGKRFEKSGAWENGLQFYRYSKDELHEVFSQLGCPFEIKAIKHLPDRLGSALGTWGIRLDRLLSDVPLVSGFASYFLVTFKKPV